MSYRIFVTNRPVVTILLIKLFVPKKKKLNGKRLLYACLFCRVYEYLYFHAENAEV